MRYLTLANSSLRAADAPEGEHEIHEHWDEFALTFPGYEMPGCAERSNAAVRSFEDGQVPTGTLSELRMWLFFEQRRAHHLGEDTPFMDWVFHLVKSIRDALPAGTHGDPEDPPIDKFTQPAAAEEAMDPALWAWARFNLEGRFGPFHEARDGLLLAARGETPFLVRPGPFEKSGIREILPFVNKDEQARFIRGGLPLHRPPAPSKRPLPRITGSGEARRLHQASANRVFPELEDAFADLAGRLETAAEQSIGLGNLQERKDLEQSGRKVLAHHFPERGETNRKTEIPGWSNVGNADFIVRESPASRRLQYIGEFKWCGEGHDVLHEAVWDLFKMALAATRTDVGAAFLVTGASDELWDHALGRELFDDDTHSPRELCAMRFPTGSQRLVWDWLLEGGNDTFPAEVPAQIQTKLIWPIPLYDGGPRTWQLRLVQVVPASDEMVPFIAGWPHGERPPDARRPVG